MNDVPLLFLLLLGVPILVGLGCFAYPFRPRRFERLFYARWQRIESRRAEIAVMWPLGFLSAFMGAWMLYGVIDSRYQQKWPVLAAFCAMVVWGTLSVARAWARRLPDHKAPAEAMTGKQTTARAMVVAILIAGSICAIAAGHYFFVASQGFSQPRESFLSLISFPVSGLLAAIAGFVATARRGVGCRIGIGALVGFAALGISEASYWPTIVAPGVAEQWDAWRNPTEPLQTPTVPTQQEGSTMPNMATLTFDTKDIRLGEGRASVEHVDFAGDGLTAVEEIWVSKDGPMTASERIFVGGEWRPKPADYWVTLGRPDGGVLMFGGKNMLLLDPEGHREGTIDAPKAGFPVAVLSDSIVYSIDEDDGEQSSESKLLSEGIFATDLEGKIIWRAASDSDERLRHSVFSFYGASRTDHDTTLVVVYGGFPPGDESLALFEFDPEGKKLTRLPLPKEAYGTKAVVEVEEGWLCALGSYDDGDGKHHLRCWRRDGSGSVLVAKVPALKGWIGWRVQGGRGEFLTWENGTVRRIVPRISSPVA